MVVYQRKKVPITTAYTRPNTTVNYSKQQLYVNYENNK